MNKRYQLILILLFTPLVIFAQTNNEVIKQIQKLMVENYVFLDKAHEVSSHLDKLMAEKFFDVFETEEEFAKALGQEMQKITKDRHLNVAPPRPRNTGPRPERTSFDWHLQNLVRFRDGGFGGVNFFEGNVAYLQLKGFRVEDTVKVDPLMEFISTADAIIVDLRGNGGGNGPVGTWLSSYFLPTNIPLTSVYERRKDHTDAYFTIPVKGKQRLDVPLYILTNSRTFSAAEGFTYDLQARKRVTVIGEVTGGGAHPVNFMRLPKDFALVVPIARSINPITKTNWEGVGVQPDVKVASEIALDTALVLAKQGAKKYREAPFNELEGLLKKEKHSSADQNRVLNLLQTLLERGHIENFMVNGLGYDFQEGGYSAGALSLMKSSTQLFPKSPNVHDSYAEILAKQGFKEEALIHYQKAVMLATEQKDRDLAEYEKNLNDFKSKK
tara:strand:- start:32047 stop:33369 length:1323 start_codon:yes stop_codon:yes gene_type:complete